MPITRSTVQTAKPTIGEAIIVVTKSMKADSRKIENPHPITIETIPIANIRLFKKYLDIFFIL